MVTLKFMTSALGALLAFGAIGTAAAAGSQLRITGSPYGPDGNAQYMTLATGGTAVRYSNVAGQFTAQIDLEGFLFCNHVDSTLPSTISLVARHGSWNFGSTASSNQGGVVVPVPGINLVDYNGQKLTLDATLLGSNGGLQCYHADARGHSVSDLNHIFVGSFDSGETGTGSPNSSAVKIDVTAPLPDPAHPDQGFNYTITVVRGSQAPSNITNGTQSETSTDYYLNEGYDTNVFSDCNIVLGQPVPASSVWTQTRFCHVKPGVDMATLDPAVPVVSAALFTGPNAQESDFSDNLAFGYPEFSGL